MNNNVGNGGLSIRSKKKSLKIIEKYEYDDKNKLKRKEDVFFCYHFQKERYFIPKSNIAEMFSCEEVFSLAAGMHKIYDWQDFSQMKQLLNFDI